jgi:hypothetical protein
MINRIEITAITSAYSTTWAPPSSFRKDLNMGLLLFFEKNAGQ